MLLTFQRYSSTLVRWTAVIYKPKYSWDWEIFLSLALFMEEAVWVGVLRCVWHKYSENVEQSSNVCRCPDTKMLIEMWVMKVHFHSYSWKSESSNCNPFKDINLEAIHFFCEKAKSTSVTEIMLQFRRFIRQETHRQKMYTLLIW